MHTDLQSVNSYCPRAQLCVCMYVLRVGALAHLKVDPPGYATDEASVCLHLELVIHVIYVAN